MYYIFTPYEDELLYSWIGRYSSVSGETGYFRVREELFGYKFISVHLLFAYNLEHLANQMPEEFNISAESLINNNTIFPFFKPFLSEQRNNEVINIMKNGGGNYLSKMGMNSVNMKNNIIRYCPLCIKEDKVNDSESYINRKHNIPGNLICHKHKIYLNDYEIINDRPTHLFNDINELNIDCEMVKEVENNFLEHLVGLCNDIEFILNGGLREYNNEIIFNKYSEKMIELGYKTHCVHHKKLNPDLLKYYPDELLKKLDAGINVESRKNWTFHITTKSRKFVHPIKHLLFIRFLFGSVEKFCKYEPKTLSSKETLYPCLNPIAHHFKQKVVNEFQTYNKEKVLIVRCKCSCGFTYSSRKQYLVDKKNYKIGKIINFGSLWDNTLKNHIMSKKYKLNELAKLMGTTEITIKAQVIRLGLENEFGESIKFDVIKEKKVKRNIENELKLNHRLTNRKEAIEKFISSNNTNIANIIRKEIPWAYNYVKKYDEQWIKENLVSIKYKNHLRINKYWLEKDAELSEKVTLLIASIKKENSKIKITKRYLAEKLHYLGFNSPNTLNKLPNTKKIIDNEYENAKKYPEEKDIYYE